MLNKVTTVITSDKAVANNDSRLSICLAANGFSFSVVAGESEIVTFGEVEFDFSLPLTDQAQSIKEIFNSLGISTFGFRQAFLIVPTDCYVWIPEHLHDTIRDRQYLRMVCTPDISLGVYHIAVPYLQSMIVFSAPTTVVTSFKLAFPGIDVHCQHSILASRTILRRSAQRPVILMHVRERVGDFEVFFNGRLLLSNSFVTQNENELLYHAIELMKQFHLETPDMELAICGKVDRKIFAMLQHYFPNVVLYTGSPLTYTDPQFQSFPTYKHVLLFP